MGTTAWIVYIIFIIGIFYFMAIRPQRNEQKRMKELIDSLAVGDYCVTTSGFYGKIIDITSDMVIVEFGNKNCRIPMMKTAISKVEKSDASAVLNTKGGAKKEEIREVKEEAPAVEEAKAPEAVEEAPAPAAEEVPAAEEAPKAEG